MEVSHDRLMEIVYHKIQTGVVQIKRNVMNSGRIRFWRKKLGQCVCIGRPGEPAGGPGSRVGGGQGLRPTHTKKRDSLQPLLIDPDPGHVTSPRPPSQYHQYQTLTFPPPPPPLFPSLNLQTSPLPSLPLSLPSPHPRMNQTPYLSCRGYWLWDQKSRCSLIHGGGHDIPLICGPELLSRISFFFL